MTQCFTCMQVFDLMHVMIEDPDDVMDYHIASHIWQCTSWAS